MELFCESLSVTVELGAVVPPAKKWLKFQILKDRKENRHVHKKYQEGNMLGFCFPPLPQLYSLKNSLMIHEEKTKEITTMSVVLYVMKNHVNLHKL